MTVAGLLLAAGRGSRYGGPKALARDAAGEPWLTARCRALLDGGCAPVVAVLGAAADEARPLLPDEVVPVVAERWPAGMGESLRAGLDAVEAMDPAPHAVLVALVDLPGLSAAAVRRLAARASAQALAQAVYGGRPGHPVVIGRDHWPGVRAVAVADRGAREYLRARDVLAVECGDVGTGEDEDAPPDPPRP